MKNDIEMLNCGVIQGKQADLTIFSSIEITPTRNFAGNYIYTFNINKQKLKEIVEYLQEILGTEWFWNYTPKLSQF